MAAVRYAVYARLILKTQAQCVKIVSVRHYPRWTHRRPSFIVENTSSQEERERWKLNVEREIVKHSSDKTRNLEKNLPSQPDSYQESHSRALLKENFLGVSHETYQSDSEYQESFKERKITNHEQINFKDSDETVWNNKKVSDSVRDTSNVLEGFSFKRAEEAGKQKQPIQKRLNKIKIHTENEIKTKIKMRESAQKLGVPVFTDLGTDDTILSKFLTAVKSKKQREKRGKILLEGKRLIIDALKAGVVPEAVFFSRIKDLKDLNLPDEGVKIYKIIYKKLCFWSDVATSQGVMAILNKPNVGKKKSAFLPLTVICDNVRDPGNLGTILRTCAGVGCKKVVLTEGCVDLWDPKVLRAGAGAHFRLSISEAENWDALAKEVDKNSCVCIAENKVAQDLVYHWKAKSARDIEIESDSDTDDDVILQRSESGSQKSEVDMVPVVPYYALDYTSFPSIVLIVGGETEGISFKAYHYVSQMSGVRINIPMSNDVDSLNCSIALGVVAFEMKKQFNIKGNISDPEVKVDNSQNSEVSVINV